MFCWKMRHWKHQNNPQNMQMMSLFVIFSHDSDMALRMVMSASRSVHLFDPDGNFSTTSEDINMKFAKHPSYYPQDEMW